MTVQDAPATDEVATTEFVFEAQVRFPNGRLEAVVRYDGDGDTLKNAARQVGVEVEDAGPDADGNRRVRITGSAGNVTRAIEQYATRARSANAYQLGNIGVAGW
jgi:hypothetical protein